MDNAPKPAVKYGLLQTLQRGSNTAYQEANIKRGMVNLNTKSKKIIVICS
jgi:hypothetical protein